MAYQGQNGWNPVGLGVAIAINGGLLALAMMTATTVVLRHEPPALESINIPIEPPPPPIDPPPPVERAAPAPAPLPYLPPAPLPAPGPVFETTETIPTAPLSVAPIAIPNNGVPGTLAPPVATPAPPVLVDASVDPRYRAGFQPDYPAIERNLGRDGLVVVRVRVGTDGRVRAVERVHATSDAFFEATRRRALAHWRFRPATRDGVAEESWREMTVRFTLADS